MTEHYGADLAAAHAEGFGAVAAEAAALLLTLLADAGLRTGTVLDLGCGAGALAAPVSAAGYDVTGLDISPSMVELARAAVPAAHFEHGSVHDVQVPSGAVAVTAVGEVLSYATDGRSGLQGLNRLAEKAANALVPGGVLLLDVVTHGRLPEGRRTSLYESPTTTIVVEGDRADDRLTRRILTFRRSGELWRRSDETHVQHLYDAQEVLATVRAAGLEAELRPSYGPTVLPGWTVLVARQPPHG